VIRSAVLALLLVAGRDDGDECMDEHNVVVDGQCYCEAAYNWCAEGLTDLTCCEDPAQREPEED
jgi:hypothetical protein